MKTTRLELLPGTPIHGSQKGHYGFLYPDEQPLLILKLPLQVKASKLPYAGATDFNCFYISLLGRVVWIKKEHTHEI